MLTKRTKPSGVSAKRSREQGIKAESAACICAVVNAPIQSLYLCYEAWNKALDDILSSQSWQSAVVRAFVSRSEGWPFGQLQWAGTM